MAAPHPIQSSRRSHSSPLFGRLCATRGLLHRLVGSLNLKRFKVSEGGPVMKALKIIGIVVVVLLLVAIALPFLINVNSFRPKLESALTEALGREVKVGNLSLSILSGSVSAEDLSIADDPAYSKDPFIRAKSLKVGVEVMPLIFSKALHVTDITLDQPEIALLRDASGKWNFSSLGNKSEATSKPAAASSGPSSTPDLSVSKLDVKDGRLLVNRANSSIKPHVYDNVDISVRDFSPKSQL